MVVPPALAPYAAIDNKDRESDRKDAPHVPPQRDSIRTGLLGRSGILMTAALRRFRRQFGGSKRSTQQERSDLFDRLLER